MKGSSKGKGRMASEGRFGKGAGGDRDLYERAFEAGLRKGKGKSRGDGGVRGSIEKRSGDRKGGKRGGKGGKNRKEKEPTEADLDNALDDYFGDGTRKTTALDSELDKYMGGEAPAANKDAKDPASKGKSEGILKEDSAREEKRMRLHEGAFLSLPVKPECFVVVASTL